MDKFRYTFIFLVCILFACDSPVRQVEEGEVVNIYSNTLSAADQPLFSNFERSSGIKVNIINDTGDRIISRLAEQDSMLADLIVLEGITYLQQAKQAGLLDTLSQGSIVNTVPAHFRDRDLQWLIVAYSANLIGYQRDSVDTLQLRSYADLADAQWIGKLGRGSREKAVYQSQLASMLADEGESTTAEWMDRIVKNMTDSSNTPSTKLTGIADSIAWLSLVNTSKYFQNTLKNNQGTLSRGLIMPVPEAYLHVTGVSIANDAPHASRAHLLLNYLFSREVMQQYASLHFLYPARPDVEIPPSLGSMGTLNPDTTSQSDIANFSDDAGSLIQRSGWR